MSDSTAIDLDSVRAFLAAKDAKRQKALDERFARASADFANILEAIKEDGRAKRVWQWGSLLDRRKFSEISDIDVAVEGLEDAEAYFGLLGKVMDLTAFPLDLVELEKVGETNARHIRERGSLVYERSR